jgi:hypothetical protein
MTRFYDSANVTGLNGPDSRRSAASPGLPAALDRDGVAQIVDPGLKLAPFPFRETAMAVALAEPLDLPSLAVEAPGLPAGKLIIVPAAIDSPFDLAKLAADRRRRRGGDPAIAADLGGRRSGDRKGEENRKKAHRDDSLKDIDGRSLRRAKCGSDERIDRKLSS